MLSLEQRIAKAEKDLENCGLRLKFWVTGGYNAHELEGMTNEQYDKLKQELEQDLFIAQGHLQALQSRLK